MQGPSLKYKTYYAIQEMTHF